jgi:hypothetical protein
MDTADTRAELEAQIIASEAELTSARDAQNNATSMRDSSDAAHHVLTLRRSLSRDYERLTALENLPADWAVTYRGIGNGWLVTRDHGALVVGFGYTSLDQALNVAARAVAS